MRVHALRVDMTDANSSTTSDEFSSLFESYLSDVDRFFSSSKQAKLKKDSSLARPNLNETKNALVDDAESDPMLKLECNVRTVEIFEGIFSLERGVKTSDERVCWYLRRLFR